MREASSEQAQRQTGAVEDTSAREIVISRTFDAPRELVFAAWTSSEHLAKWWGPRGFTTTTKVFDFRSGGSWSLVMHGPDGVDYPYRVVLDELAAPERIVFSHHGGLDGVPAQFRSTVTFLPVGGKTHVTMRQLYTSTAERDAVIEKYGAIEGGKQTFERLAELLAMQRTGRAPDLLLTRVFAAPRQLVFEAWTQPEHLEHWWGPTGFTLPTCQVDFRPGGAFLLGMRGPDGTDYPFPGVYEEIVAPERLVTVGTIHAESGKQVRTTVTFREHGGKTTVTVEQVYFFEADDATRGANVGWTQSLDRLAAHLANV